jgi:hypothetical protein
MAAKWMRRVPGTGAVLKLRGEVRVPHASTT